MTLPGFFIKVRFVFLLALISLVLSSLVLAVETRDSCKCVPLVIGNSAYTNSPLKNLVNDAKDIAAKLRKLGFEVIERNNFATKQFTR